MTTPMSAELLAAVKADLAVPGRWKMISVHTSAEQHTMPGDPPVTATWRHVTATLSCQARGVTLVFLLAGPEGVPPVELKMHYMGTPYVTDDAGLIARIDNAVGPLIDFREAEMIAKLAEPLP